MKTLLSNISFYGKPENYASIDKYVSRSAQPKFEDFRWLKEQGVTDIINFRTMYRPDVNFDEEIVVKDLGLKYHNIQTVTNEPNKQNIDLFLSIIEEIKKRGGKAHIHCKAGADRTGMYSLIYKMINGMGSLPKNLAELYDMGYHYKKYPKLVVWTINFVNKVIQK